MMAISHEIYILTEKKKKNPNKGQKLTIYILTYRFVDWFFS